LAIIAWILFFAEKSLQAIFGVLQHYRHIATFRCAAEIGRYPSKADIDQTGSIKLD